MLNKICLPVFALAVVLSALCNTAMTSSPSNAQNSPENSSPSKRPLPENSPQSRRPLLIPPIIPPTEAVEYAPILQGQQFTGHLGLPVAQLINIPTEFAQKIDVWVPPKNVQPSKLGVIAFEVNSSIRYTGNGHTVILTTARLSPAAQEKRQVFLGEREILAGGITAYSVTLEEGTNPNRIVFKRGNVIVSIASDLPMKEVKRLAEGIALVQNF